MTKLEYDREWKRKWRLKRGIKPRASTPKSLIKPSLMDIAWTAGVYEGEGTVGNTQRSIKLVITQKDPEILFILQKLFGGRVCQMKTGAKAHRWNISGARALGLMFTIFKFLSKRRKEQFIKALNINKQSKYYQEV